MGKIISPSNLYSPFLMGDFAAQSYSLSSAGCIIIHPVTSSFKYISKKAPFWGQQIDQLQCTGYFAIYRIVLEPVSGVNTRKTSLLIPRYQHRNFSSYLKKYITLRVCVRFPPIKYRNYYFVGIMNQLFQPPHYPTYAKTCMPLTGVYS